jgi:pilus assembly protein Flp/PilA
VHRQAWLPLISQTIWSFIMNQIISSTRSFLRNEEGVTAIEYGLIAALIAVAVIAVVSTIGTKLNTAFQSICTKLNNNTAC